MFMYNCVLVCHNLELGKLLLPWKQKNHKRSESPATFKLLLFLCYHSFYTVACFYLITPLALVSWEEGFSHYRNKYVQRICLSSPGFEELCYCKSDVMNSSHSRSLENCVFVFPHCVRRRLAV